MKRSIKRSQKILTFPVTKFQISTSNILPNNKLIARIQEVAAATKIVVIIMMMMIMIITTILIRIITITIEEGGCGVRRNELRSLENEMASVFLSSSLSPLK